MSFEVPCCHIVLGTMRTLHETLHPLSQPHYYRSCRCRLAARWAPACTELRRRERAVERHRLARWDGGSAPFAGGASVLPRSCAAAAAAAGTPTRDFLEGALSPCETPARQDCAAESTCHTVLRNRGFFPILRCCSKRQLDALPWTPAVDLRLLPHQEHCCHHTERACDAPRLVRVDTAWCTPTSSMHNAACTIPVIECTQEPFECSVYSSHSN